MNLQNQPSKRLWALMRAVKLAKHYASELEQYDELNELKALEDEIRMDIRFAEDYEKELPFPYKPSEN